MCHEKPLNCLENNQTCHLLNIEYDSHGWTTLTKT